MPDLDEKYNEFSRELSQSVSPETEPTEENVCDERSYDERLKDVFQGKIVRKDLTKKIKEGANVPVYVLEFLLGQYCSSDDPEIIESGVETVKHILSDNFVRPDEAQKNPFTPALSWQPHGNRHDHRAFGYAQEYISCGVFQPGH